MLLKSTMIRKRAVSLQSLYNDTKKNKKKKKKIHHASLIQARIICRESLSRPVFESPASPEGQHLAGWDDRANGASPPPRPALYMGMRRELRTSVAYSDVGRIRHLCNVCHCVFSRVVYCCFRRTLLCAEKRSVACLECLL